MFCARGSQKQLIMKVKLGMVLVCIVVLCSFSILHFRPIIAQAAEEGSINEMGKEYVFIST